MYFALAQSIPYLKPIQHSNSDVITCLSIDREEEGYQAENSKDLSDISCESFGLHTLLHTISMLGQGRHRDNDRDNQNFITSRSRSKQVFMAQLEC